MKEKEIINWDEYLENRLKAFSLTMLIAFVLFGIVFAVLVWFVLPYIFLYVKG